MYSNFQDFCKHQHSTEIKHTLNRIPIPLPYQHSSSCVCSTEPKALRGTEAGVSHLTWATSGPQIGDPWTRVRRIGKERRRSSLQLMPHNGPRNPRPFQDSLSHREQNYRWTIASWLELFGENVTFIFLLPSQSVPALSTLELHSVYRGHSCLLRPTGNMWD